MEHDSNNADVLCTAHHIRQWILDHGRTMESFVMRDIQNFLNVANPKEISAGLSKLHKIGALQVIGRRAQRVSHHGFDRSYIYKCDDLSAMEQLEKFAPRRKPNVVSRERGYGVVRKAEKLDVPIINSDTPFSFMTGGAKVKIENEIDRIPNDNMIEEIISIGIDLETQGATRQTGLRLLKLTERVFRVAK